MIKTDDQAHIAASGYFSSYRLKTLVCRQRRKLLYLSSDIIEIVDGMLWCYIDFWVTVITSRQFVSQLVAFEGHKTQYCGTLENYNGFICVQNVHYTFLIILIFTIKHISNRWRCNQWQIFICYIFRYYIAKRCLKFKWCILIFFI